MAATTKPLSKPAEPELVITRVFDAPRALVWRAWTEPEHFRKWYGPKNFTVPVSKIALRVGGRFLHCMRGPGGREIWTTGVYREIVPLERLVYTDALADANGHVVPASQLGMPGDWAEPVVTVTFEDHEGKTRLTLRHVGLPAGKMSEMAGAAWNEAFDKLANSLTADGGRRMTVALPSDREIVLTRVFVAPRRLVFEAFSKPEHVKQWWGPRGYTMVECEMDFRPGGTWRYVIRGPQGLEPPFKGEYREIAAPERLVYTFIYDVEGIRDHPAVITIVLREHQGTTTMTETMVFDSVEARDGMLASGMEAGAAETLDRLAELLATM